MQSLLIFAFIILLLLVLVVVWKYRLADLIARKIAGYFKKEEPISTTIGDARPHLRTITDYPPQPVSREIKKVLAQNGKILLNPGVYDLHLESFCLDAGKHIPSPESRYLIAPLKGKQSTAIRHILRNSAKHPDISQEKIQALIWAIASGTKYKWLSRDLQLLAERLLPEKELMLMGKSYLDKIPSPIRNRLLTELRSRLPQDILRAIFAYDKIKEKIADARTTYEELERVVVRFGKPPVPDDMPDVKVGEWSLIEEGYFMRVFPEDYRKTRIQVYVPERHEHYFDRDAQGRITRMGVKGGMEIRITFDDSPEKTKVTLNDGREIPVWRFKKLSFSAPDPAGKELTYEIADMGWVVRDPEEFASLDPERYPEVAGRIEAARDIYHDAQILKEVFHGSDSPGSMRTLVGDGGREDKGESSPIDDITDLGRYIEGVYAVLKDLLKGIGFKEKLKWLLEHFERLLKAWEYVISMLAGTWADLDEELRGPKKPPPGPKKFYCPTNILATPANPNEQRLGFGCALG